MIQEVVGHRPDPAYVDVLEHEEALRLVIDLPGVTPETLTVRGMADELQIEARREKPYDGDGEYLRESRDLYLDTTLPMPPTVDPTAATATLSAGVLEVTVPKRSPTQVTVDAE